MLWPVLFLGAAAWWLMQPRVPSSSSSSSASEDADVSGSPAQFWRDAFSGRDPIREDRRRQAAAARARARTRSARAGRVRAIATSRARARALPNPRRPLPPVPASWVPPSATSPADECANVPALALRDASPEFIAWWLECPGRTVEDAEALCVVLLDAGRAEDAQAVAEVLT